MRSGGRSTLLFVGGALLDTYCVINVPGAAELTGGDEPAAEITTVGVLIVLLSMASWTTVFLRARAPLVVVGLRLLMLVGVSYALALVGVYHALIRWPLGRCSSGRWPVLRLHCSCCARS